MSTSLHMQIGHRTTTPVCQPNPETKYCLSRCFLFRLYVILTGSVSRCQESSENYFFVNILSCPYSKAFIIILYSSLPWPHFYILLDICMGAHVRTRTHTHTHTHPSIHTGGGDWTRVHVLLLLEETGILLDFISGLKKRSQVLFLDVWPWRQSQKTPAETS